jgi:hypothetical protein
MPLRTMIKMIQDLFECSECGNTDIFIDAIPNRIKRSGKKMLTVDLPLKLSCLKCMKYVEVDFT